MMTLYQKIDGNIVMDKGKIKHFLSYFLCAGAGVILDWCVWSILFKLTGNVALSQSVSRCASAFLGFYLSRNVVFKHVDKHHSQIIKYFLAVIFAWCLSLTVVTTLSHCMSPWFAKIISDGTTFVVNYWIMKYYVFPHQKTSSSGVSL